MNDNDKDGVRYAVAANKPERIAIGEVNCFDRHGMPVIRLYPCAVNVRNGAQIFAEPYGMEAHLADAPKGAV